MRGHLADLAHPACLLSYHHPKEADSKLPTEYGQPGTTALLSGHGSNIAQTYRVPLALAICAFYLGALDESFSERQFITQLGYLQVDGLGHYTNPRSPIPTGALTPPARALPTTSLRV